MTRRLLSRSHRQLSHCSPAAGWFSRGVGGSARKRGESVFCIMKTRTRVLGALCSLVLLAIAAPIHAAVENQNFNTFTIETGPIGTGFSQPSWQISPDGRSAS